MDKEYCYPNTDVLVNKFGLKDNDSLSKKERMFSAFRLTQLMDKPIIDSKFDLNYLRKIHNYIFQDVYSWSGELRTVNINKGNWFCMCQFITDEANRIFGGIEKENNLKNLNIDNFSSRIAYYAGEINALHPFREGNGRATREFIRCLSYNAGYTIDFSRMDTNNVFNAFVKSFSADYRDLKNLFKNNILQKSTIKSKLKNKNENDLEL